jgi:hypothetical protein
MRSAPASPGSLDVKAHWLWAVCRTLEFGVWCVILFSLFAFGGVHPWAYRPVWLACACLGGLLLARSRLVLSFRRSTDRRWLCLDVTEAVQLVDEQPRSREHSWTFDLQREPIPSTPLVLPWVIFLVWVGLQLAPLPEGVLSLLSPGRQTLLGLPARGATAVTVSVDDSLRGATFLLAALLQHLASVAVFAHRSAIRRFRTGLVWLGGALAFLALVQAGTGTRRIYGFFTPLEWRGAVIFGPFVSHNHFGGYMLMLAPFCLGGLWKAVDVLRASVKAAAFPRTKGRRLLGREGTQVLYAGLPAVAAVAAIVASLSRGSLVAFFGAMGIAAIVLRRRAWTLLLLAAASLVLVLGWYGTDRATVRFRKASLEGRGRVIAWKDSLARMRGLWLTGTGFNTYGVALSRVPPFELPAGSTPWPAELTQSMRSNPRIGYRAPEELEGISWIREAHNDYLQLLVETGVVGALLGLWALLVVISLGRGDPWILAALSGVLLHVFVDFDLQIPAIPLLLVSLVALGSASPRPTMSTPSGGPVSTAAGLGSRERSAQVGDTPSDDGDHAA